MSSPGIAGESASAPHSQEIDQERTPKGDDPPQYLNLPHQKRAGILIFAELLNIRKSFPP